MKQEGTDGFEGLMGEGREMEALQHQVVEDNAETTLSYAQERGILFMDDGLLSRRSYFGIDPDKSVVATERA